jgi:hypothetical protein
MSMDQLSSQQPYLAFSWASCQELCPTRKNVSLR